MGDGAYDEVCGDASDCVSRQCVDGRCAPVSCGFESDRLDLACSHDWRTDECIECLTWRSQICESSAGCEAVGNQFAHCLYQCDGDPKCELVNGSELWCYFVECLEKRRCNILSYCL